MMSLLDEDTVSFLDENTIFLVFLLDKDGVLAE